MAGNVKILPASVLSRARLVLQQMDAATTVEHFKNGNGETTYLCRLETRLGRLVNHDEEHASFISNRRTLEGTPISHGGDLSSFLSERETLDFNPHNGAILSYEGGLFNRLNGAIGRMSELLNFIMKNFDKEQLVTKCHLSMGFFSEENIQRLLATAKRVDKSQDLSLIG